MGVDWQHSGLARVVNTSETWLQEVLMNSYLSSEYFFQYFMADWWPNVTTWQRKKNIQTLEDDTIAYGYVTAYRGFAKTTQLTAYLIRCLCLRLQPFILFSSRTLDHAAAQTENVKAEILSNPYIREVFGSLKPQAYEGTNPAFSSKAYFLSDPKTAEPFAFVSPKGANMQVNGSLIRICNTMQRPTFIAIDDGEDREDVMSEELRAKYKDWFWGALLECVPDVRPNPANHRWDRDEADWTWRPPWRVWQQDTVKHEDSNMSYIQQAPEWVGNTFPLAEPHPNGGYRSLVPELVSTAQVNKDYQAALQRGMGDRFAMEKLCVAQISDDGGWSKDLFKYFRDRDLKLNDLPRDDKFVIVDPAKTAKAKSAATAMLGVAVDCRKSAIYLRDLINARMEIDEAPVKAIEMCLALNTPILAVEITGLEDWIKLQFKNEVIRRGLQNWITFVWLDAREAAPRGDYGTGNDAIKRARASYLLNWYRKGDVYHEEILMNSALERQQLSFPKCSRWDALDCASYIPKLLEMGGRYWQPAAIKDEPGEDSDAALIKAWEEQEKQKAVGKRIRAGSWRMLQRI